MRRGWPGDVKSADLLDLFACFTTLWNLVQSSGNKFSISNEILKIFWTKVGKGYLVVECVKNETSVPRYGQGT